MSENAVYEPMQSVYLRPEEFADDAASRLGRANGNTHVRKPGVENVHDGQIMVRLKKKRYIILDYGYTPNQNDHELARTIPHISIPHGAGQTLCTTPDCPRIGIPVLLYDSEPNEPMSLYLRGGLCFSCQRNLNEKRRTQRKRKPDGQSFGEIRIGADVPSVGSGSTNGGRVRYNDQLLELSPDAIVINGPVEGTRTQGPDYRCHQIGSDIFHIVSELSQETLALMHHSSRAQSWSAPTPEIINQAYQKAFLSASRVTFLLTQWKASFDAQQRAAEAAVVASTNFDSRVLNQAVAPGGSSLHHGMALVPSAHFDAPPPSNGYSLCSSSGVAMGGGFEWGLPTIRVSNSPTQLPPTPTDREDDETNY
ncbi:hypothetical protein ACHAXA_011341 [Cyclostephanos tholiformis]|uniref:Uncharacterized protein n=1 Tax=Cyclostephanos tholiformis TaxID=382380 RepID=A0ABD3REC4_9STRA